MLSILDCGPNSYIEWATEYYEEKIDSEAVHHTYEQLPLSNLVLKTLNRDATMGRIQNHLVRIGYAGIPAG